MKIRSIRLLSITVASAILYLGVCATSLRAQSQTELPILDLNHFAPSVREQLRKAYDEARARSQDSEAIGRLGMILQSYEQYEFAAICYERARALAPTDFRWGYYLGIVLVALGKNADARAQLQDAARQRPDYLPAQIRLADLLLLTGDRRESQRIYELVLKKSPGVVFAFYGLGRIKADINELSAAVEYLSRACELSPHFGAAHYALAMAHRNLGQTASANEHISLYQKDRFTRPALNDPLLDAVSDLNSGAFERLKKASNFEAEGDLEHAAAEYERALEINPRLVQAQANLISVYGRLGQTRKAEKRYQLAVENDPNLEEAHYNYGVMLSGLARYDEAAAAFRRSLEINPYHAEAHHNYASLLEREGRLNEAAEQYKLAISNNPALRVARFNLGRILVHQGKLAEAIDQFLNTLTPEDENTPRFMYALAAAYARFGDRERAIMYARGARQRASDLRQTELLALIERDLRILEQSR